jgi:hypothetical protein
MMMVRRKGMSGSERWWWTRRKQMGAKRKVGARTSQRRTRRWRRQVALVYGLEQ